VDPASNASASQSRDTVAKLSLNSHTSSPVHCSTARQTVLTPQPASPIFSTSLVAESGSTSSHHQWSRQAERQSPTPTEVQPQSLLFSPPTDMDTDVSAIIGEAAENSELLKSDISFEVNTQHAVFRVARRGNSRPKVS